MMSAAPGALPTHQVRLEIPWIGSTSPVNLTTPSANVVMRAGPNASCPGDGRPRPSGSFCVRAYTELRPKALVASTTTETKPVALARKSFVEKMWVVLVGTGTGAAHSSSVHS